MTNCASVATVAPRFWPSQLLPVRAISSKFVCTFSFARGVAHPDIRAASVSHATRPSSAFVGTFCSCPSFQSRAAAVGHEPQPLSDVRCADARSRQTGRPEGVAESFQVSLNKVEPPEANRCFNLLAKDDCRVALLDEVAPDGPKVPLVSKPRSAACRAERLTRTGPCPDGPLVRPSGKSQGGAPAADAGEEVALSESSQIIGPHVLDASVIDFPVRDHIAEDEVAQPLGRVRVVLVVVGGHVSCEHGNAKGRAAGNQRQPNPRTTRSPRPSLWHCLVLFSVGGRRGYTDLGEWRKWYAPTPAKCNRPDPCSIAHISRARQK